MTRDQAIDILKHMKTRVCTDDLETTIRIETENEAIDFAIADMKICKWNNVRYTPDRTAFDVLNEISSSYYGKQMFFLQDNGFVYDRYKAEYITFEEAVSRMAKLVGDDGDY